MLSRLRGAVWNTTCRPGKSSFSLLRRWIFRVPFRPVIHAMSIIRKGAGKDLLDEEEHVEQQRWESLSTREKVGDWALKHQYPLIVGSWAVSLGVAAAIIMKDRHQTTSQKVCQTLCLPSLWLEGSDRLVGSGRSSKLVCGRRD